MAQSVQVLRLLLVIGKSMAVPVMKWIGLRLINYINQYSTQ